MYIKKYDKYYPHNYEPLIDRWLFEKCKEVRTGKTTNQPKQSDQISTKKSFIFANLIKCKITNRVLTCDDPINRHGKQYIYLMPWKPENSKKKMYVREDEVLKQIEWVFDSMTIKSEKLKQEMNEYLRQVNNSEKKITKMKQKCLINK